MPVETKKKSKKKMAETEAAGGGMSEACDCDEVGKLLPPIRAALPAGCFCGALLVHNSDTSYVNLYLIYTTKAEE